MKYSIDFLKLAAEILPPRKRTERRVTFLYRLLAWFRGIWAEFITDEATLRAQSLITSQVIIFESYLVDEFGAGITITVNSIDRSQSIVYSSTDTRIGMSVISKNQSQGGSVIYSSSETLASAINFTVNVPAALNADLERMAAIINKYKTPGSTYEITES